MDAIDSYHSNESESADEHQIITMQCIEQKQSVFFLSVISFNICFVCNYDSLNNISSWVIE